MLRSVDRDRLGPVVLLFVQAREPDDYVHAYRALAALALEHGHNEVAAMAAQGAEAADIWREARRILDPATRRAVIDAGMSGVPHERVLFRALMSGEALNGAPALASVEA